MIPHASIRAAYCPMLTSGSHARDKGRPGCSCATCGLNPLGLA